ncbi:MAG TPA: KpsF/GutQ family sugar-phosphate isomerase [Bacteriovoracaceae bacterium]|nr:KpsF/GutQ family sugar-phosphate isomerase [Bacteriovoracaceae bacterium]
MDHKKLFTQVLKIEAEALERTATLVGDEEIKKLVALFELLSATGGSLIISGVGKSGHIGKKIAATFSSLALPSFFLHPTEAMHGDLGRVTKADALVMISKSGSTEELLLMLPYVSVPKARVIAIVGNVNSPIAQKSGIVLDASVEKEACINDLAPTTSTTVALALGDAMAVLFENVMGVSKEKFAINHPAGLLGKSLSLTVDRLMLGAADCPSVNEKATLQDAILAMTQKPVGMCAIVDGTLLKGIIVEGDIRRAFAKSPDAIRTPVKELMTVNPISLTPSTLAFEALKSMESPQRQITVVPVVLDGHFKGVLRLHDLFKAGFQSSLGKNA